jgi:hypothetical protein
MTSPVDLTGARRGRARATGGEPEHAEWVIDKPARKHAKRDVLAFFDNDAKVSAPFDAKGPLCASRLWPSIG